MLANNAEAEVSRKSAEKERRTVEQTELQAAQEAQEAILHDIQTALDSISKRVTAIEETQQHDWQTQVQQHDKITKIQTQMLQQQQAMHQYEKDALDMQAGEQKQNRQREQEAAQQHAEVFQRLHATYTQLQIGWHRILRFFPKTLNLVPSTRIVMGYIISTMIYHLVLIANPMGRILVR
jgi:hypothetical protein